MKQQFNKIQVFKSCSIISLPNKTPYKLIVTATKHVLNLYYTQYNEILLGERYVLKYNNSGWCLPNWITFNRNWLIEQTSIEFPKSTTYFVSSKTPDLKCNIIMCRFVSFRNIRNMST